MSVRIKKPSVENENENEETITGLKVVQLDPKTLIPYANNAKIHSYSQIQKLKGQISEFGFDQPVVVDKDFVIIKGHGRTQASIELNLPTIPVVVASHLSPSQVKAARIADNKVSSTDYDEELLKFELGEIRDLGEVDINLTGFDEFEMEQLFTEAEDDAPFEEKAPKEKTPKQATKQGYGVLVRCNDESHQLVVFEDLISNGYDAKILDEK